jgi:hypothetical protein
MPTIKTGTTDPTLLLVPVFLRTPTQGRYIGTAPNSVGGATVTFTQPNGGGTNTRTLISRGNGRYEMQLLDVDVVSVGNGWVDVIDPGGTWVDFDDDVQVVAA